MRLVRCGLFVLAFVIGIQLFCVSLWRNAYLSVATMFSITLRLAALITWVGLKTRIFGWFRKSVAVLPPGGTWLQSLCMTCGNVLSSLQLSARIELPIGSTRAGDLS